MDEVDRSVIDYLHDLLSEKNQNKIAAALRQYQAGEGSRMDEFTQALKKRIIQKEKEYDTLMKNLSSGVLPAEIVKDIGEQMQDIKAEIAVLETTKPPRDFTVDQVRSWLDALKACPDEKAIHLLVERIDIKQKTEVVVTSTLTSVLSENGCGGRI